MPVDDLWYKKGPDGKRVPSAKHGRGKRYRVRFVDGEGNKHQPSFVKKVEAEDFHASVRTDLARGHYVDPKEGRVKLRDRAALWLADQTFDVTTRQTVESRLRTHILPGLGDRELVAIKPSTVQSFIRGMQTSGLAPRTIQVVTTLLSGILGAAADDGAIPKNPCRARSVRPPPSKPRKVIPFTLDEVFGIADGLPDRYESMIYLGYGAGLRQGEILGFGLDDADFLGRSVRICRQVRVVGRTLVFAPPKGDKERDIPLDSETALRLSAHIRLHPPVSVTLPWRTPDGKPTTVPLLFSRSGHALHRSWVNAFAWNPAVKAVGLPASRENGMHKLRHTYASTLLAEGVDIRAVAEYLGHTDPGFTLRIYTHLMPAAEDKARSAIERAYRGLDVEGKTA